MSKPKVKISRQWIKAKPTITYGYQLNDELKKTKLEYELLKEKYEVCVKLARRKNAEINEFKEKLKRLKEHSCFPPVL